jgi:hypothetical protein
MKVMTSRNSRRTFELVLACALLMGCQHPALPPAEHGVASFRILEPRASAQKTTEVTIDVGQPHEVIELARPFLPLKKPVFPRAALRGHDAGAFVAAHVTVGVHGEVKDVAPGTLGFTTPSPFAEEYWAAVEAAVRAWRFQPAEVCGIEYMEHDGKTVLTVVRREFIDAEFDVAFTFTATGEVVPAKR